METSASMLERLTNHPSETDWRRMVELYQPWLRSWCLRSGAAEADAEDLVQETLAVVLAEVKTFDRQHKGAFRAWLRGILANRLKNFFRARRNGPITTGGSDLLARIEELEAPDSSLSREWDRAHDRHVAIAIMALVRNDFSPGTWRAFHRLVLEEASADDVAAELGLSVNAVLLAKSRVLKRLRAEACGFI